MVTCCCEWFTDGYELFTSYLRTNQSVDNLKKIFDMSKNLPLLSRILKSVYELLQVVTSYLRIPASYLRMLAIDYELAIRKDS